LLAAERTAGESTHRLWDCRARCAHVEAQGVADETDRTMVADCERRDLPGQHERREQLHSTVDKLRPERTTLTERLRDLNQRIARLRKDAEGEIVAQARVVATTLARSRAHPAVARETFDVVLVDEAGAARVGEVLLAVSRATHTSTLLGDFLQLGPVTADVDNVKKPGVRKWLIPNGFTHCGIRTPDEADRSGSVALIHQFRFGPNLRRLANDVVYKVLTDGVTAVSGRSPAHTDIVVVDVEGLGELSQVHRSGPVAGWWPVGALLSRSLARHHVADSDGAWTSGCSFAPSATATCDRTTTSGGWRTYAPAERRSSARRSSIARSSSWTAAWCCWAATIRPPRPKAER
jgi:hypothetical protein